MAQLINWVFKKINQKDYKNNKPFCISQEERDTQKETSDVMQVSCVPREMC